MIRVKGSQKGFTIVELMIATAVFSAVLLVITYALIYIGRTYYKGLTSTRTQEVARSVVDDVAQAIQFSGGSVVYGSTMNNGDVQGVCAGDRRYSFLPGVVATPSKNRVLVADNVGGCDAATKALSAAELQQPSQARQSLLGENMRIAALTVTDANPVKPFTIYNITVRVVYGDDESLCSPSKGDCNASTKSIHLNESDIACKNNIGLSEFCWVSEVSAQAVKRVE